MQDQVKQTYGTQAISEYVVHHSILEQVLGDPLCSGLASTWLPGRLLIVQENVRVGR